MVLEKRLADNYMLPNKISMLILAQTLLEKIKTLYNEIPGLPPDKIAPTVGQNSKQHLSN
jgi:hypothetical protein